MKYVSLDNQNDVVKQFVLSLTADRNGAVVELDGKEVMRVLPARNPAPATSEPWTDSKNQRRSDLIDRKIAGTLTVDESSELADLQQQMLHYRDQVAPLPLDYARQLHQKLLRQANGQDTGGKQ